jgi:hypothetical protein
MPFTNEFKDKYVAPGFSAFTAATIPDMSDVSSERGHWLRNFILNSSFRASMDDGTRRTLYSFLRRTESAFQEYEAARTLTLAHLAEVNPDSVSKYLEAIAHWEQFLSHADRAWTVLVRDKPVRFEKNDGSTFQRLNFLYNVTKHLESAIKADQFPPDGTLPVWLTNDGLQAVGQKLDFIEIEEMLRDLGKWADAAQDPLTMRETIRASYGLGEEDGDENTEPPSPPPTG